MTLTHYGFREWGSALLILLLILAGCWYLGYELHWMKTATGIAAGATVVFLAVAAFSVIPAVRSPKIPV